MVAGADVQDRDAVTGLIEQAGGTVTGRVELTDAVGDPARADQLRELTSQLLPTGAQLPAASDTGSLVGGLLGGVLLARDGEAAVRPRRRRLGAHRPHQRRFRPAPGRRRVRRTSCSCSPAERRTGWTPPTPRRSTRGSPPSSTSRAPARCWPGAAGRPDATGAVGVARADPQVVARLSTVDDVQSGAGRVAAVLALHEQLDGRAGSYGTGTSATDGAAPAVRVAPGA